jgi:uncharacterized membrane protein YkvA (DUF1232 family)
MCVMADKKDRSLDSKRAPNENFFGGLYNDLRLIVRLLKDRRVNFLLKFLPLGALIYLVIPLDIFPINPLDDALVVWLGASLFIELCPDDIVQEHREARHQSVEGGNSAAKTSSNVVDAEFKDLPPDEE